MNRQEVFDTIVTHLRTQGKPARAAVGNCRYRMEDPNSGEVLRCAIGCLIPDELYSPEMEGAGVTPLIFDAEFKGYELPEILINASADDRDFLSQLQRVHDQGLSWDEHGLTKAGEERMRQIANDFHLRYEAPQCA